MLLDAVQGPSGASGLQRRTLPDLALWGDQLGSRDFVQQVWELSFCKVQLQGETCIRLTCVPVWIRNRRFRICERHLKMLSLCIEGKLSRFCQQCGRFHVLEEFEGQKRYARQAHGLLVSNCPAWSQTGRGWLPSCHSYCMVLHGLHTTASYVSLCLHSCRTVTRCKSLGSPTRIFRCMPGAAAEHSSHASTSGATCPSLRRPCHRQREYLVECVGCYEYAV